MNDANNPAAAVSALAELAVARTMGLIYLGMLGASAWAVCLACGC